MAPCQLSRNINEEGYYDESTACYEVASLTGASVEVKSLGGASEGELEMGSHSAYPPSPVGKKVKIRRGSADGDISGDVGNSTRTANSQGGTSISSAASDDGMEADGFSLVAFGRYAFIILLIVAALILSGMIYTLSRQDETESFEVQFKVLAEQVIVINDDLIDVKVEILQGLSKTATSILKDAKKENNQSLPGFLTFPDVQEHFGTALKSTRAVSIGYFPLIKSQNYQPWVDYSTTNSGWILEANHAVKSMTPVPDYIWEQRGPAETVVVSKKESFLAPLWQFVPPPPVDDTGSINRDMTSIPSYAQGLDFVAHTGKATLLDSQNHALLFNQQSYAEIPQTAIVVPVFDAFDDNATVVGGVVAVIPWESLLEGILVEGTPPINVVISNTCNQTMTFEVSWDSVTYLGEGNIHEKEYSYLEQSSFFGNFGVSEDALDEAVSDEQCIYHKTVYATKEFEESYTSFDPIWMAALIFGSSLTTALAFVAFDCLVSRRHKKLLRTAQKQHAIVSSLFPKSVHKKLMQEAEDDLKLQKTSLSTYGKAGLRNYLREEDRENEVTKTKPIADLFPETTIMFADIAGFTAWASTREPSHVFVLLESIYREFDHIAKKRRVFKVEVVGDCYVAVCGLPDARKDHAIVMAKFARDCLRRMNGKTKELEIELGPDTTELKLRVGLHSGPVVAGVLRGEKSRFQLFGDTMNTASRMESTGIPDYVQISKDTADLLAAAGKEAWFSPRETRVKVKGKGLLQTFFLNIPAERSHSSGNSVVSKTSHTSTGESCVFDGRAFRADMEKTKRVAEWTVEVLAALLKEMVTGREARGVKKDPRLKIERLESKYSEPGQDRVDEVAECIVLPDYSKRHRGNEEEKTLNPIVIDELRSYVQTIASLYNSNPFHNFEHASHVVMSVNKLLSRIVAPDLDNFDYNATEKSLHDHTYGITSDPLTQFSVLFSALIHDVDHSGKTNAQLVKEQAPVARLYNGKSPAEQNSFDVAWDLLMEPDYRNLRDAIYVTTDELQRFRQLVVNSVMATDIVDKDLKKLRNDRWDAAFAEGGQQGVTLKATIVIEHLIQASDVAHTMQHWHVYRRWNERFFYECYRAYKAGHADKDPSETWYEGELGFFDFYIIPLAKKLKECGVFGVSSDEYLAYATQNRKEWEERGREVVQQMREKMNNTEIQKLISSGAMPERGSVPERQRSGKLDIPFD